MERRRSRRSRPWRGELNGAFVLLLMTCAEGNAPHSKLPIDRPEGEGIRFLAVQNRARARIPKQIHIPQWRPCYVSQMFQNVDFVTAGK